jgi:hypothetical protein
VLSSYGYDIYKACKRVAPQYAKWRYQSVHDFQQIERVFAYELYHQIRLIMLNNQIKYNLLQLNGEISKVDRFLNFSDCGYTGEDPEVTQKLDNYLRVSPDIVLHKDQNDRDFAFQKVIIEVKTGDDTTAKDIYDIIKLLNYVEQLNFENAIFVAVNKNHLRLCNTIRASFSNADRESFSKCSIFFYTGEDLSNNILFSPRVNFKTIKEIINNE